MSRTRNGAFALALAMVAASPSFAGNDGKFDGTWSVSVVTEKGDCNPQTWTVIVAGNRLQRVRELPVSASGSIDAQGQARFNVASMVNADGMMHDRTGSGRWDAPSQSCSGRWRAARL
ncbi:MAG TPA: hypothetical protein P5256_19100 [Beijerinckiaceae bacterium]|nr:hypothetical protein [Rhodoblastus sp.]MCB1523696.1 hypothetical protein [Rhodoblastus sp.]MCC0000054.1 hypothetical protein [Methylobacteriaceae bacterium]MCO5088018.1 hypothetical protein [Methylobacteriaceae bacterium]HRY05248.1 hypothetical protein [Beijerinckiaceae bacterium]